MKLVDSCVWAEVLMATPTGQVFKSKIPPHGQLLVSTMVLYELGKWLARNVDSEIADQVLVTLLNARVVEPTASIALQAAELSVTHKLHALDALIYATALEHDAELVTCDVHFKDLPQVDYTAKVTEKTN
jgi:predicted nucleic acid-binding protein